MVGPGVHINAIGGDCPGKTELDAGDPAALRVFVEYRAADPDRGRDPAASPPTSRSPSCGRSIDGSAPGRTSPEDITVFDSVGFAIEDFSALRYTSAAVEGTDFYDPPRPDRRPGGPKDLFGFVMRSGAPRPQPGRQWLIR